jgi:hypothetical protein
MGDAVAARPVKEQQSIRIIGEGPVRLLLSRWATADGHDERPADFASFVRAVRPE